MMRKDVKLGFAIGGVLLAVLVVYVLVGTGNSDPNNGAGIVTEDTSGGKSTPNKLADANAAKLPGSTTPNVGSIAGNTNTTGSDATRGVAAANDANGKSNDANDMWKTVLTDGQMLISKTPDAPASGAKDASQIPSRATPDPNGSDIKGTASNTGTLGAGDANAANNPPAMMRGNEVGRGAFPPASVTGSAVTGATDQGANGTLAGDPTTRPSGDVRLSASGGQWEHTVKPNETLSLIAQAAYGNANLYPAIMRANPNLDPKKMRPGMTIILPPISDVRPDASAQLTSSRDVPSSGETTIDSKSEYRVQSNDSLYRIAMKLYGKPEMVAKIYELNKETIGSDPGKLKLNMLLKLPEPPTQSASR